MSGDNNDNGGRSLGGGSSEPLPASWGGSSGERRVGRIGDWGGSGGNSGSGRSGSGSRFGTLGGLGGGSSGGGGQNRPKPGNDDDSDSDKEEGETWFAGGDRSGLSVQNPGRGPQVPGGNMVQDLLRRAAQAGAPPETRRGGAFSGGGHTLGSDEVESTFVPDPTAPEDDEEPVIRHITFWRNGFTVEDGDLYRYDDPANEEILSQIHSGRAPTAILNVRTGQPVEVRLSKKTDEDYVPKAKPFGGSGHRLGAPVPGTSSDASSSMPGTFPAAAGSSSSTTPPRESITTRFEVDQSLPTTSVQIRLADGTRMVARMNLTHKVQDIRNFINAARPENLSRPYTISTTFPNVVLEDNEATIEAAKLANSVVVQRWA